MRFLVLALILVGCEVRVSDERYSKQELDAALRWATTEIDALRVRLDKDEAAIGALGKATVALQKRVAKNEKAVSTSSPRRGR